MSGLKSSGTQNPRPSRKADACAVIACYADDAGGLARFTREALAADKLSLTAEALDLFVSRLPEERGVARQEIARLSLFLGPGAGRVAAPADLADFLGVEPRASLAAASRRYAERRRPPNAIMLVSS